MKILRVIATILQFLLAVVFAIGYFTPAPASAENYLSPSVNSLYRIDSEYMRLSEFPNKLILYEVVMIDVDTERAKNVEEITANLYLPLVPDNLNDIILFDGYHVAHFNFERINEVCVRITVKTKDLEGFDGNVGLYLFVTGYKE